MAGKETDLLRDPVLTAQLRFREQVEAFKDQYVPKPKRKDFNAWARANNLRPDVLLGRRNGRA